MSAITVPTVNVSALYVNTTSGIDADPQVMDNAIIDIVATINSNASEQNANTNAAVLPHADGSVTTSKIADLGVTTAKIAALAVTTAKLADANVTTAKLADSSVTLAKMADSSVGTSEIVDLAVTNAKLADGVITADKFVPGVLTNETANGLQIVALKADNAMQVNTLAELVNVIALGTVKTVNIPSVITVSANLTIPSTIRLQFTHGGRLKVNSGITLTLNCLIDAGDYQIFEFVDASAILMTDMTKTGNVQQTLYHNVIRLAWFGAKGDATFNSTTQALTGTDDSAAIRRAFDFAGKASSVYPNFGSMNAVTIEATPNSMYAVQGNNILGCQDNALLGVRFEFKGNGCTFYHKPLLNTDALMSNMRLVYRPNYHDFGVYVYGFVGRLGRFFDTNGNNTFNSGVQGLFNNIVVGDWTQTSGYDIIFNATGTNMVDNYKISNSQIIKANVIYRNVNKEAVNWKFDNCALAPSTVNGIVCYLTDPLTANFSLINCEMLLSEDFETLIKIAGTVTDQRPVFLITGRIEIQNPKHTLIDADAGFFDVNGLDMTYGASPVTTNSFTAKLSGDAFAKFTNCTLSENCLISCATSVNYAYKDALIFDECSFFTTDGFLRAYPLMTFKKPDTSIIAQAAIFGSDYTHKDITVSNPRYSNTGAANLPIKYSFRARQSYDIELFNKYAAGKITLPYNSYPQLPYYCIIYSAKIFLNGLVLSNVNKIKINVLSSGGGLIYSQTIDLTTYVSGAELFVNQYLCIEQKNQLELLFYLNTTLVNTLSSMPNAWIALKYKAMASALEYNAGTVALITI